jgi:superfamily II DNA or RNA helicase
MKIIIENIQSKVLVGGKDFLIDPDLMENCRKYLSIKVPGSFFAAKKLRYHWDGNHYFLTPGGKMATGFLPVFLKFLGYVYPDLPVEIVDQRGELPRFTSEFVATIGPRTINEQYIHQKNVIEAYNNTLHFRGQDIYFPRGVADAATNAGKTAIIAGLYLNLEGPQTMLVTIHRVGVYAELLVYFKSIFGEVGQINQKNYSIKPVTLAMIQTLSRRIEDINVKKDLAGFSVLAVDECHRAGSKEYTKTLVHCQAPVRVFVSGSAFSSEDIVAKMIIVGLSGERLIQVTKKELMDKGISAPIKVKMHLCNTILREPVVERRECVKVMVQHSLERASIMLKIIKARIDLGPILIAVEETHHGEYLLNTLTQYSKDLFRRCNIELTHSKDPDILSKIDAFRNGDIDVMIATGVLKEGLNLPLIQTIILASGGQSGVYIRQWMGRGERIHDSKKEVEFHDFYDIGRYVQDNSLHRIKIYKKEELFIEMDFDMKSARKLTSIVIR